LVKTVRKAFALLDTFTVDVQTQGVTEIATKLGTSKSSAHALLAALKDAGYVIHDPETRKYSLGFKPLEMAARIRHKRDVRDLCLPIMRELSKTCHEDIAWNILVEGRRVCTMLVESQYFVRQFVPIGKALPLHCSAAGKVLMAYLPQDQIDAIAQRYGLPRFTPHTITDRTILLRELELVRQRGYAESREEFGKDAAALAFPVFSVTENVVAALSIQSTVTRLTHETRKTLVQRGQQAAKQVSTLLKEVGLQG
jgi:DNA-binding IclR family transcriptional regulator